MKLEEALKRNVMENAGRKKWEGLEIPRHLLFTLEITHKCILKCRHCFAEASPENNDFLESGIVEKLAQDSVVFFKRYPRLYNNALFKKMTEQDTRTRSSSSIRITGGDPFLHPDIYRIIQSFSSRKQELGYGGLDVETNGWWATEDETASKVIRQIKKVGADCLSMSLSNYHEENSPFNNLEHYKRIKRVCKELGMNFRGITVDLPVLSTFKGFDDFFPQVTPIGRARQLEEEYWGIGMHTSLSDECRLSPPPFILSIGYIHDNQITIDPRGDVYACNSGKCFQNASLSLGNLHKNSIIEIIDKDANPIVRALRERGTRTLTKAAGLSLGQHYELYDKLTPCGLCHEMLRLYGKEITTKLCP